MSLDANGQETVYQYDDMGRLISETSTDTGTTTYAYNAAGSLVSRKDARGVSVAYTPDVLGRTRQIDYPYFDGQPAHSVTYTYDEGTGGRGRLIAMSDASGSTAWDYSRFDDQGILEKTTTINGFNYTTNQSVTPAGRITRLTYPSGRIVDYLRNSCACAVSGVTTTHDNETHTLLADVGYRPFGLPLTMDIGNAGAPNVDNRYDSAGRLTAVNPESSNARTYTHDANGNTTGIQLAGAELMGQQFTYDHLNRIDTNIGPFGLTTFGYDPAGNRTRQNQNGLTDTFAYETGTNRLEIIDRTLGTQTTFVYDAHGNTVNAGDRIYTYNQDNRLARIDDNGFVAAYVYNGLGQRVIKTTADATTCFHYDFNNKMIAETPADSIISEGSEYIYKGKVLLAHVEVETQAIYTFHTNYLGAVHQITDANGMIVWEGIYKPFGEAAVNPGSIITNNWRLPGQYYDQESGLYYNYFRYYDPNIGRYLTPDPIGLEGGINRYVYVSNKPLNSIDPFGLQDRSLGVSSVWLLGPAMSSTRKVEEKIIKKIDVVVHKNKNGQYFNEKMKTASKRVKWLMHSGGFGKYPGTFIHLDRTPPPPGVRFITSFVMAAGAGSVTGPFGAKFTFYLVDSTQGLWFNQPVTDFLFGIEIFNPPTIEGNHILLFTNECN